MIKLLSSALLISLTPILFSQNCAINANASQLEVTCGQSAVLSAFGSSNGSLVLDENFNSGGFGSGWGSTPGATNFTNPCSPGGVNGTPHAWMDNNTSVPRTLTSASYNLLAATAGVTICFDLLFATQGNASPCEGPDEPDEGVYLQYSINGGATWIDITYFDPNGGNDPQLTNWNNWCFALPAAALTANTLIRWHQIADSGADYDHWGIDNVQIFQNDINAEIVWLHDGYSYGVGMPGGDNPTPVTPTTTTTYTAQITTGTGDICTATVTVLVIDPIYDVTIAANPTSICPGDCATITGVAQIILDPGGIETYENNEFELVVSGSSSVNVNVQGINTNSIYSGLIQNVTINGFSFTGTSVCAATPISFSPFIPGTCPCGTTTVNFGQTCTLNASSFTVTLSSPGGCTIILAPSGVANGNYTNVVFVPVGGTAFNGSFPNAGPWNPQQPFSNFNGCDPNGVWELSFDAPGLGLGLGTLFGWSITFDDPPIYAPVDVSWSPTLGLSNPSSLNTDACPMVSTDYVLTLSNGTPGCAVYNETVSITVIPCNGCLPPVQNIIPLSTCAPGTVNLFNAIAAGSAPAVLSYHASQVNAQNAILPINQIVGISGSYWIRAEDPIDPLCFAVFQVVVTINPLDNAGFSLANFCLNSANAASGIATPGGTFSFSPNLADGSTINASTGSISNGVFGTTYTVQYATSGACPSTSTQTVAVTNLAYNAVVLDENCGAGDGEINLTPVGGSPTFTYSIDGGTTTQAGASFIGLSSGNYTIEITANNGCLATGFETIAALGGATINNVVAGNESCLGICDGSVTLTVSGGSTPYTFDFNGTASASNSISNLCSGTYNYTVVDGNGCANSGSATINTGTSITGVVSNLIDDGCSEICDGEVQITSATAVAYLLNGTPNVSGNFTNLCEGNYTATFVDLNGCSGDVSFNVGTALPVIANFNFSPTSISIFNNEVNFFNASSNADQYLWVINGENGLYDSYTSENISYNFPADTGSYEVCLTAENDGGCFDSYCVIITVLDELLVLVPNTFTPDGDEFNQTFLAYLTGVDFTDFSFYIFNRWGEMIWESHDVSVGWDGTYDGKPVQDGAYTWQIKVGDLKTDLRKSFEGHVNVLK